MRQEEHSDFFQFIVVYESTYKCFIDLNRTKPETQLVPLPVQVVQCMQILSEWSESPHQFGIRQVNESRLFTLSHFSVKG